VKVPTERDVENEQTIEDLLTRAELDVKLADFYGQRAATGAALFAQLAEACKQRIPDWLTADSAEAKIVRRITRISPPPPATPEPTYLTKEQYAEAVSVSPRTIDNHLRDELFREQLGIFKTSNTRNGHWRFPAAAVPQYPSYRNAKAA
jgi:hypothetical protein